MMLFSKSDLWHSLIYGMVIFQTLIYGMQGVLSLLLTNISCRNVISREYLLFRPKRPLVYTPVP